MRAQPVAAHQNRRIVSGLPFVEALALAVEMLHARHAIDDEEGVVFG